MGQHQFGRNKGKQEGDIFFLYIHEPWTMATFPASLEILDQVNAEFGGVYLVVASYIENPLPAPIRQAIAMHARKVRYKGVIVIGGSLVYRTVLNLMSRAMSLISGKPSPIPRFVTDEAAARATIAQLRQGEASDKGHGA